MIEVDAGTKWRTTTIKRTAVTRLVNLRTSVIALISSILVAIAPSADAEIITVVPGHPSPGEPILVIAHFPIGGCIYSGTFDVTVNAGEVLITQNLVRPVLSTNGTCDEAVQIDGLSAGRYHLTWIWSVTPDPVTRSIGEVSFVVGDVGPPVGVPALSWTSMAIMVLGVTLAGAISLTRGRKAH